MQRIFKYGGIQNIILTLDKELNILIYRMPSYVIILSSYALQKMVRFFGPPCMLRAMTKEVIKLLRKNRVNPRKGKSSLRLCIEQCVCET